ncbi:MAG: M48 family metalloprotease [Scytolyngbya sp. HA4215-MV1]|nr:M48 family metalloprotease [Scytolyngbya sp. HA4215-MV1]
MASIPDSPQADGSSPSSRLERGLAELKQGQYAQAIADLEPIAQAAAYQPDGIKAQMGLVSAYEKIGQPEKAISLCQSLSQHASLQVREWGSRNLASLSQRYPQALAPNVAAAPSTEPDQTGFVPLENLPSVGGTRPVARAARPDSADTGQLPPRQSTTANSTAAIESAEIDVAAPAEPLVQELDASAPSAAPPSPLDAAVPETYQPTWRQADRAKIWNPLGKIKFWRLWLVQLVTAIAFFAVAWSSLTLFMGTTNRILYFTIRFIRPIQAFYRDPTQFILITLAILLVASPWLLDAWLQFFYQRKSLSLKQLSTYSPEAARVLSRLCQQKKIPLPTLNILPVKEPIALTYGCLPRLARIVVSQGLLESLAEDEIATICAGEVAHIVSWDFIVLSGMTTALLIPYTVYWRLAIVGDHLYRISQDGSTHSILRFLWQIGAGGAAYFSALAYGIYWLLRFPTLWLSRQRVYYSDRIASDATGNPNGLTRALLKFAIATSEAIQQQGRTSYLLEGFDLLSPLGHRLALSLGSLYAYLPLEQFLAWDQVNPYAPWLSLNHAHPPIGDRLRLLALYARHWKLDTELDFAAVSPARTSALSAQQWQMLLLQGAPFWGVILGAAIALSMWMLGAIAKGFRVDKIAWLWGDHAILFGWLLLGFSIGAILRFNQLFPDIPVSFMRNLNPATPSVLSDLMTDPNATPLSGQPIVLEGKLLGRQGIANWLGQDLILQTHKGAVKLHYFSQMGPLGNFISDPLRPCELVNQSVTLVGWLRRGATPWVDVDLIRSRGGRTLRGAHQFWSTLAALLAAAMGIFLILRGGA